MAQTPPTIGTIPTPPDVVNRQSTFHSDAVAMFTALKTVAPQIDSVGKITYENAVSVELSAAIANAQQWASGTYSTGAAVWSPIATAAGTPTVYIRKAPGGASPTDPANDPTNWVKYVPSNTTGAAVYTTSTTLTSGSPFAISVSGGAGVWIKLPDAVDGLEYAISNSGDFDLSIKKSNGDIFGFLQPKTSTILSASAGNFFGKNIMPIGNTASILSLNTISPVIGYIKISGSRRVIIANNYAFLFDSLSQSVIYSIAFRSGAVTHGCAISVDSNKILICSAVSSSVQIDFITIAGDILSVSSSPPSFTASPYFIDRFIKVNDTFVLYYSASASPSLRCVTVSGTTASIGSEYVCPSGASFKASPIFQDGDIIYLVYSGTGSLYCQSVSIAGQTITAGTPASSGSSIASPYWFARAIMMPNGNICAHHANAGNFVATFFKPNGNSVSAYSANICGYSDYAINGYVKDISEIIVIDSNKVFFAHTSGSLQNQMYFNLITDNNNGTATAGTAVNIASPSNNGSIVPSSPIFCEVKAKNSSGGVSIAVSNYGKLTSQTPFRWEYKKTILTFNCAGASPILAEANNLISDAFTSDIFDVAAQTLLSGKDAFGNYDPSIFVSGGVTYGLAQRTNWAASKSIFANALIGACGRSIKAIGEVPMPQLKLNTDNNVFYSYQSIGGRISLNVYEVAK